MTEQNIIVLGGAGYIGSHTCKKLKEDGFQPVVIDNLYKGHERAVQWGPLEIADLSDTDRLAEIMEKYDAKAVIHFAALSEVGESVKNPTSYYENNIVGTLSVLKAMEQADVKHIVFSSTAATYGEPEGTAPLAEDLPLEPINPYGNTKLAAERMIRDIGQASGTNSACLRYFNACGADKDGDIGEMHYPESHLIPLVIQTALGMRDQISIFGTDYDTEDGTCIRDYIHVEDLASAHVKAVQYLIDGGDTIACNLGTGNGYSVKQIIDAVRFVTGNQDFKAEKEARRAGDPPSLVARVGRAKEAFGWEAQNGLTQIVQDAYDWHKSEPYQEFWASKHNQRALENG